MNHLRKPVVSVVLPVFNGERFIEASVRSVLGQSFVDLELIIVNDGSTDSTLTILERLAKTDCRVILVSQSNQGLVSSLNAGVKLAKGDYVARMDADDLSMLDRFSLQLKYLQNNVDVDIVGGQVLVQDEAGVIVGKIIRPVSHECVLSFLRYGCPIVHPTYMVRTSVFKLLGGYRDIAGAEDLDFLIRAALLGCRMGNLEEYVLIYTRNLTGISSTIAFQQMRNTRILLANYRERRVVNLGLFSRMSNNVGFWGLLSRAWFNFFYILISNLIIQERKRYGVDQVVRLILYSLMHYELSFSLMRKIKRRFHY